MDKEIKFFSVLILGLLIGSSINLPNAAATECIAPDRGDGTVNGPSTSCNYIPDPQGQFQIIDGLPFGTGILIKGMLQQFTGIVITPGIPEKENANAVLKAPMDGFGTLAGFHRMIDIPINIEFQTDPRTPGLPDQVFDAKIFTMQGQIVGDPDFDLLRITAGNDFGLPSPGGTHLTNLGGGNWEVDSFFDITYRIDFIGAPGSPLAGHSGSTTGIITVFSDLPIVPSPVGGKMIPVDTTALLIAGASTNGFWVLSILGAIVAAFAVIRFGKRDSDVLNLSQTKYCTQTDIQ